MSDIQLTASIDIAIRLKSVLKNASVVSDVSKSISIIEKKSQEDFTIKKRIRRFLDEDAVIARKRATAGVQKSSSNPTFTSKLRPFKKIISHMFINFNLSYVWKD